MAADAPGIEALLTAAHGPDLPASLYLDMIRGIYRDAGERKLAKRLQLNPYGIALAHNLAALAGASGDLEGVASIFGSQPHETVGMFVRAMCARYHSNQGQLDIDRVAQTASDVLSLLDGSSEINVADVARRAILDSLDGPDEEGRWNLYVCAASPIVYDTVASYGRNALARAMCSSIDGTRSAAPLGVPDEFPADAVAPVAHAIPAAQSRVQAADDDAVDHLRRADGALTVGFLGEEWCRRLGACPRTTVDLISEIGSYEMETVVPALVVQTASTMAKMRSGNTDYTAALLTILAEKGWILGCLLAGANPGRRSEPNLSELSDDSLPGFMELVGLSYELWAGMDLACIPAALGEPALSAVHRIVAAGADAYSRLDPPGPLSAMEFRIVGWELASLGVGLTTTSLPS